METKKVKTVNVLDLNQLGKVFGGLPDTCDGNGTNCKSCSGDDDKDCTSEAASGGTTTDKP